MELSPSAADPGSQVAPPRRAARQRKPAQNEYLEGIVRSAEMAYDDVIQEGEDRPSRVGKPRYKASERRQAIIEARKHLRVALDGNGLGFTPEQFNRAMQIFLEDYYARTRGGDTVLTPANRSQLKKIAESAFALFGKAQSDLVAFAPHLDERRAEDILRVLGANVKTEVESKRSTFNSLKKAIETLLVFAAHASLASEATEHALATIETARVALEQLRGLKSAQERARSKLLEEMTEAIKCRLEYDDEDENSDDDDDDDKDDDDYVHGQDEDDEEDESSLMVDEEEDDDDDDGEDPEAELQEDIKRQVQRGDKTAKVLEDADFEGDDEDDEDDEGSPDILMGDADDED